MNPQERNLQSPFCKEARRSIGTIRSIKDFFSQRPEYYERYLSHFDNLVTKINDLMSKTKLDASKYKNVIALKASLDGKVLTPISELPLSSYPTSSSPVSFKQTRDVFRKVTADAKEGITTSHPDWSYLPGPDFLRLGERMSRLLVYGYGKLLEETNGKTESGELFAYAFLDTVLGEDDTTIYQHDLHDYAYQQRKFLSPEAAKKITLRERIIHLPHRAIPQHGDLPPFEKRQQVTHELHQEILEILQQEGIPVQESSYRAKTDESMERNRFVFGRKDPLMDIYGVRIIVVQQEIPRVIETIQAEFPTPDTFPWEDQSVGDYSQSRLIKDFGSHEYRGIHLRICFDRKQAGSEYTPIAEIQIYTPEWYETANTTRQQYEEGRKKTAREVMPWYTFRDAEEEFWTQQYAFYVDNLHLHASK